MIQVTHECTKALQERKIKKENTNWEKVEMCRTVRLPVIIIRKKERKGQ